MVVGWMMTMCQSCAQSKDNLYLLVVRKIILKNLGICTHSRLLKSVKIALLEAISTGNFKDVYYRIKLGFCQIVIGLKRKKQFKYFLKKVEEK